VGLAVDLCVMVRPRRDRSMVAIYRVSQCIDNFRSRQARVLRLERQSKIALSAYIIDQE
jgi:hypothetical protein